MNSRQALAVAVFFIFTAAIVVEFSGLIDREPALGTASATGGQDGTGSAELKLKEHDENTVRNAVMGGFIMFVLLAFIRMREDYL